MGLSSVLSPLSSNFHLLTSLGSESSSALEQVNDHDDDGNHDQEMDETAADVAEEAEKPEHEQDNNYSPEHDVLTFRQAHKQAD